MTSSGFSIDGNKIIADLHGKPVEIQIKINNQDFVNDKIQKVAGEIINLLSSYFDEAKTTEFTEAHLVKQHGKIKKPPTDQETTHNHDSDGQRNELGKIFDKIAEIVRQNQADGGRDSGGPRFVGYGPTGTMEDSHNISGSRGSSSPIVTVAPRIDGVSAASAISYSSRGSSLQSTFRTKSPFIRGSFSDGYEADADQSDTSRTEFLHKYRCPQRFPVRGGSSGSEEERLVSLVDANNGERIKTLESKVDPLLQQIKQLSTQARRDGSHKGPHLQMQVVREELEGSSPP